MKVNEMTAGILAGGKHTRMGQNKLLLSYEGETFLEHLLRECSGFGEVLVSAADAGEYEAFPCRVAVDEKKNYGPLEGIYQLLKKARAEYVFVMAGDMPGLTAAFLEAMAQAHGGEDCLVLRTSDGGIHPLCAVYAKRLLPKLAAMREAGERRPRKLYEQCRVRFVTAGELGFADAVADNINTPEEYERLVRQNETD